MEENNTPVQDNPVNDPEVQAVPATPVTPQAAAPYSVPQPVVTNPAVIYQQPPVQQVYYTRPVPNGYGMYVQPVRQVQPVQPVQAVVPVRPVQTYQPNPAATPVIQPAQPQPAQSQTAQQQTAQPQPAKAAEPNAAPAQEKTASGNGGKRSVVMPVIFSIAIALLVIYCLGQSIYVVKLNKKLDKISAAASEVTETEPGESKPQESGEPSESDPSETEPGLPTDKTGSERAGLSTTQIVAEASPATIPVYVMKGNGSSAKKAASGTGFIISADGYIVTNAHVVQYVTDSPSKYFVTVMLPDETDTTEAQIVGYDTQTDIAVLKVKAENSLPSLKFGDSDKLKSGETVIAIGNALGQLDDTVTVGVVSATNRDINTNGYTMKVIQTDAAINNGNSGGPLLNTYGEVIGITNAKIVTSTSEGLGFAIPINSVKSVIDSLISNGKVIGRPYLGVSVKQYAEGESEYGDEAGVYVMEIVKGGPADKANLKVGDRLISLDGVEINTTNDIILVRDKHKVGDTIICLVERNGTKHALSLTIADSGDFQTTTPSEDEDDGDYED